MKYINFAQVCVVGAVTTACLDSKLGMWTLVLVVGWLGAIIYFKPEVNVKAKNDGGANDEQ